jgi:hypothetical protein
MVWALDAKPEGKREEEYATRWAKAQVQTQGRRNREPKTGMATQLIVSKSRTRFEFRVNAVFDGLAGDIDCVVVDAATDKFAISR